MAQYLVQTKTEPLFSDLLWSRPENKMARGKILIIGGQAQEFSTVASAYNICQQAGAGQIRILMPESTRKYTKHLDIDYAPANKSGSFERTALADLLDGASWADSVLLAGNLGKNSETSLCLDSFVNKCPTHLIIASEALESISLKIPELTTLNVSLILNFTQAQKGLSQLGQAITNTSTHQQLATSLQQTTADQQFLISFTAPSGAGEVWTAQDSKTALTKLSTGKTAATTLELAAKAAVWTAQNPSQIFRAVCTSMVAD